MLINCWTRSSLVLNFYPSLTMQLVWKENSSLLQTILQAKSNQKWKIQLDRTSSLMLKSYVSKTWNWFPWIATAKSLQLLWFLSFKESSWFWRTKYVDTFSFTFHSQKYEHKKVDLVTLLSWSCWWSLPSTSETLS